MSISFIIPCANDSYVGKTVASIIQNLNEEDEIIIVGEVPTNTKINNERIKIINIYFSFAGKARNIGAKFAKNEILAFVDCGVVISKLDRKRLDSEDGVLFPLVFPNEKYLELNYPISGIFLLILYLFGIKKIFSQSRFFFIKRDVFLKNKLYFPENFHFGEENIWANKLSHFGIKISFIFNKWAVYVEKNSINSLFVKCFNYGKSDMETKILLPWQFIRIAIYMSIVFTPLFMIFYLILEIIPLIVINLKIVKKKNIKYEKAIFSIIIKDIGLITGFLKGIFNEFKK